MTDNWPSSMRDLVSGMDAMSSPGTGLSIDCVFPESPGVSPTMAKHAFFAVLPIVLSIAAVLTVVLTRIVTRSEGASVKNNAITAVVVVFFLVVMRVAKVILTNEFILNPFQ